MATATTFLNPRPGLPVDDLTLDERLGGGGFSEVWRAHHKRFGPVAVKIPHQPEAVAQLRREAELSDRLHHPGIVPLLQDRLDRNPPYLVVDLVEGHNLRQILQQRKLKRLPWQETIRIVTSLLDVLDVAHQRGVVHGDVKPENILIESATGRVRLTDFGAAREVEGEEGSRLLLSENLHTERPTGTVAYLAPEQRLPGATIDPRADVYAVGIVLFELVTGTRPEGVEMPSDMVAGDSIPNGVDELFRKLYARRDQRPKNAGHARRLAARLLARATLQERSDGEIPDRLMDEAEAARVLEVDRRKLDKMVAQGVLTPLESRQGLLFDRRQIRRFRNKQLGIPGLLASRADRFWAGVGDISAALGITALILWMPYGFDFVPVGGLFFGLLFLAVWGAKTILGHVILGRTLGESWQGVKPVRLNTGQEIGVLDGIIRAFAFWLTLATVVGFLPMLFGKRRRAFHDVITQCVVIKR